MSIFKTKFSLILLGVFVLIIQILLFFWLSQMQNSLSAFQLQFTFSRESFLAVTETWNPMDQSIFLLHYMIDFFYPALYSAFLFLLMRKSNFGIVRYLPFAAAVGDVIENSLHFLLMTNHLTVSDFTVAAAAVAATAKWILLIFSVILIIANWWQRFKKAS